MKKYIFISVFALLSLALASCSKNGTLEDDSFPCVELRINTPGADVSTGLETKSASAASLKENYISSIHYFLWADNATDSAPSVSGEATDLDAYGTETVRIGVGETDVNNLFPGSVRSCRIFVIANKPEDLDIPDNPTLDDLLALEVTADFSTGNYPASFVMTYDGSVTLDSKRKTIVAYSNVALERLASRIVCKVTVESTYHDEVSGKDWTPLPASMRLQFYNCCGRTTLDADPSVVNEENDLFDYSALRGIPSGQASPYSPQYPYYTYPREWKRGSACEPYILVTLPWYDGSSQTVFYYKVILSGTAVERNLAVTINLHIGILGSLEISRPSVMASDTHYYVEDWNESLVSGQSSPEDPGEEEHNVDAVISDARYLVVSKNVYVLNNLNDLEIPFGTSHDCTLGCVYDSDVYNTSFSDGDTTKTILAKYEDFSDMDVVKYYSKDASSWLNVNMATHMIEFHHELQNDNSIKPYDYVPYVIKFRLQHCGAAYYHQYYEEITIIQYPAMYISADKSGVGSGSENAYGYMFVNGTRGDTKQDNLGGNSGLTNAGNKNKNMYIITTTVLPENSPYFLADPRETSINNLGTWSNPTSASAPCVQGTGNRTITYYYPAKTTAGGENYLAPKFRIASSYGVSSTISQENGRKRCASYQENGHPAGRWRLPTVAEIQYMCQLTTDGYIPRLLGNTTNGSQTNYWAGNGYVTVFGGNSTTPPVPNVGTFPDMTCNVRCVYDEWYWEVSDHPVVNKSTYTWGDMPR